MSEKRGQQRRPEFRASRAELAALLAQGASYASIGRLYSVADSTARSRCLGLHLRRPTTNGRVPDASTLRFALSVVDMPLSQIAAVWGVDADHLSRAARRQGLPTDRVGRAALRAAIEEARL